MAVAAALAVILGTSYSLQHVFGVNLMDYLIVEDPEKWDTIIRRNYTIWGLLYFTAYFVLYVSPVKNLMLRYKLNKSYPPSSLVGVEILRSARGVLIASLLEISITKLRDSKNIPLVELSQRLVLNGTRRDFVVFLISIIIGYGWNDFYFYWSHRMLHAKFFYAKVHKFHHESYNPDPFSGLSMHPFESTVYFLASFILSLFVPYWFCRLTFIGQIVFPLPGHAGFGFWDKESSVNHYLHHSKFEWNYGSSTLWDHLMGTNYDMTNRQSSSAERSAQQRAAEESAKLVGGQIGSGVQDVAIEATKKRKDL
jgi:sterol desaturase/sphingolipid hydroxylase (fatty acid hydroxylase superfamily)